MPITLTVVDSLAVHEALIGPTLPEWDQRDHAVANALMEALLGSSLSRRSSPKPRTRTGYWVSGVKLSEEGDWYSTTRGQKAISLQAVDREWSTAIAELRALLVKTAEAIYRSPMLVAMHRAGVLQVEIPTIDVGLSQKKYGEVYAPRVTIVVKVCVYEGIFPLKLRVVRDAEQTTASA